MKKNTHFLIGVCLLATLFSFTGCAKSTEPSTQTPSTGEPAAESPAPASEAAESPATESVAAEDFVAPDFDLPQLEPVKAGDQIAVITTDMGDIKIRLFPQYTPKTVENFTTHAKDGYYENVIFHRVVKNFMIQTGDPLGNGTGGESIWGEDFEDEFTPSLHNIRGAVSMANAGPNTNGSQFFIVQNSQISDAERQLFESSKEDMNQVIGQGPDGKAVHLSEMYPERILDEYLSSGGTYFLDYKHTVFGQVYEGMDVVDAIAAVECEGPEDSPKPVQDIHILKIEISEYK